MAYLWRYYCQVKRSDLSYTELRNWSEMTGTPLTASEVEIIMQIDHAFIKVLNDV